MLFAITACTTTPAQQPVHQTIYRPAPQPAHQTVEPASQPAAHAPVQVASHTPAEPQTHAQTESHAKPASHGKAHWDYEDGENGPANWYKLDCPDCAKMAQSPIDIPATAPVTEANIRFDYHASTLDLVNNGHTIKFSSDKKSSITVDGKTYKLLQFHFHSPSEHLITGISYPMELHLVHQADDGSYGVVGVMIRTGNANHTIQTLWDRMPKHAGDHVTSDKALVNPMTLLPYMKSYFNYSGSFTTPPCTEGVNWMLMNAPITISNDQLKAFTALYDHNNRPVQPLNGRF
ncbi:MAG: carbonic anhydrase family protein [Phycisphaeraceae bacterium JB051]